MKTSKNYNKKGNFYSLEKDNNDDKLCCLRFSQCDDNKHQLWKLNKEEIKIFISYAKKIEKLPWREIFHNKGLNYEKLLELKIPDYLDKDISLYSMRADIKFRIIGYRIDNYFYIVWFDNNHETC